MELILSFLFLVTYALAFPPFSVFFMIFPALLLLFLLVFKFGITRRWLLLLMWVQNLLMIYWISYAISNYGGVSPFLGAIPTLLLALYLAIYPLVVLSVAAKLTDHLLFPLYTASLWVVADYVRAHFISGFPWEIVGYAVFPFRPLMNVADLGGVYLIEFIIILFISSFFAVRGRKRWIKVSAWLLIVSMIYGEIDMMVWDKLIEKNNRSVKVGVVQGNIDQSVKWTPSYRNRTIRIYERLTRELAEKGAELVVWPETAVPFYFQSSFLASGLRKLAKEENIYLLFGSPAYKFQNGKTVYTNRAYMLSPDGEVAGYYDKVHLVPFGEYLPLKKYLGFVKKIIPMVGNMGEGDKIEPLPFKDGKIGVLICYESIFPEITRSMVNRGATLLSNITNDAWFGKTSAPFQHFSMVAFRAVESKRYLIRAANTGISGFVSPTGEIVKWTPIFKREAIMTTVKEIDFKTLYTRLGDWIVALSLLFLIIMIYDLFRMRREREE